MSDTTLVGTRIYNRGDMANIEHFGTIVSERKDEWGHHVKIQADSDGPRAGYEYEVPAGMIHDVDAGNGRTRIVTEAAYLTRKHDAIARILRDAGRRAYANGDARVYPWDADEFDASLTAAKYWYEGWDAANVADDA